MKKMAITLIAAATIGGVFYGNHNNYEEQAATVTEKRIFTNENGRFIEKHYPEAKNVADADGGEYDVTRGTEKDIYAIESKADGIVNVPLKAMYMNDGGVEFFLLADGNGAFYISFDDLIDGNNYIAFVTYNDKLVSVIDGHFKFTYEENFSDAEYMAEYERIGKELVSEKIFKF